MDGDEGEGGDQDEGDDDEEDVEGAGLPDRGVEHEKHHGREADGAQVARQRGPQQEVELPLVLRVHHRVVEVVGEVQQDEHLHDQKGPGTDARKPGVAVDDAVGQEERQEVEYEPQKQLDDPASVLQHLVPLVALVLDPEQGGSEAGKEQEVSHGDAVHCLGAIPGVREVGEVLADDPGNLLQERLGKVAQHPCQEHGEHEENAVGQARGALQELLQARADRSHGASSEAARHHAAGTGDQKHGFCCRLAVSFRESSVCPSRGLALLLGRAALPPV